MEISSTGIPAEYNQRKKKFLVIKCYAVAILAMKKIVSTSTRAYENLQSWTKVHCG